MSNFIDYIRWRGDISMDVVPVNGVDLLALSTLCYGIWDGILTDKYEPVKICDIAEKYRELHPDEKGEEYVLINPRTYGPYILYNMAATERFRNIALSCYEDVFNEDESIQFAVFQAELQDGRRIIIFRGTDSTIDGWREDFSISFTQVGAQRLACEYLKKNMSPDCRYILAGHSKGGHLAEYSAMCCDDRLKENIDAIYSFDGPGMCPEFKDEARYNLIKDKLIRIVPAYSIVGMLFRDSRPDMVVKSTGSALLQHMPFTWQCEGNDFVTQEKIDAVADEINKNIGEWIEDETPEKRQAFTQELFDAFKAGGAIDVQGIASGGIGGIQKIVKSLITLNDEAKGVTMDLVKQAAHGIADSVKRTTKESVIRFLLGVGIWYSVMSMVIGVVLLGFPRLVSNLVGVVFFAGMTFCSGLALATSIFFRKKKLIWRIVICVVGMLAAATCLVYYRLWTISSGIIIAGMFLVMCAYRLFVAVQKKGESKIALILLSVDSLVSFILAGLTILLMYRGLLENFLKPAGLYLIFMSMLEFGREYITRLVRVYKE